jgi:hypothetical protein
MLRAPGSPRRRADNRSEPLKRRTRQVIKTLLPEDLDDVIADLDRALDRL